jgi:exonuclease SbcD
MKIIHLSDLHIGKRVNGFNMLEDQEDMLKKILTAIEKEKPDVALVAGDVYDRYLPAGEAVSLLDDFLTAVAKRKVTILLIGGNHDSAERLSFGSRLMEAGGVYIVGGYKGQTEPVVLEDPFGKICFYLLPFVKPAEVKRFFPDAEINSYTDAVAAAIKQMHIDTAVRNVMVTHQFVTGAERSESEDIAVGGADNVDSGVFNAFDYVALGHLHRPQHVGRETIRYCGAPLKYSFSEASDKKSLTVVELAEKGTVTIREIPLAPLRDLREIRGTHNELMNKQHYENTSTDDYLHVVLTDEEEEYNALAKLSKVYPNIMKLEYDNRKTCSREGVEAAVQPVEKLSPDRLFGDFFIRQTSREMSDRQKKFIADIVEKIWEDRPCDQ